MDQTQWDEQQRKSAMNREYLESISQSTWERIMGYEPKKKFQKGELTTTQVAEIYKLSKATIAQYCKMGMIPGAWQDISDKGNPGWWHISAESLLEINRFITDHGLEWTMHYWIRYYGTHERKKPRG